MLDLASLRAVNEEIAEQAEAEGVEPHVMTGERIERAKAGDLSALRIPNLGSYLPKNWERISLEHFGEQDAHGVYMGDNEGHGAYFVDKSGLGRDDEPALSLYAFLNHLRPGYGYAVVEEGQFQAKVGVFRYIGRWN